MPDTAIPATDADTFILPSRPKEGAAFQHTDGSIRIVVTTDSNCVNGAWDTIVVWRRPGSISLYACWMESWRKWRYGAQKWDGTEAPR